MKHVGSMINGGLFLAALSMPFFLDDYIIYSLTLAAIYTIAAQGFNVLLGFSGQISIGHAGFVAIGSYVTGLAAAHWTSSLIVIWLLVILSTCLVGILLGWICLRMAGPYLALATIGFGVIVQVIAKNWLEVTGGPEGILGIPALKLGPIEFDSPAKQYYLAILMVCLTLIFVKNIRNSRVGLAMLSIRDDEIGAQLAGINIAWFKVLAFVISGVFAGITGSLLANLTSTVFPEFFDIQLSALFIMILVIGGIGDIKGVTLGSFLIVGAFELLRGLREYQLIVYCSIVILTIMYMPEGVMGLINKQLRKRGWLKYQTLTIPARLLWKKK